MNVKLVLATALLISSMAGFDVFEVGDLVYITTQDNEQIYGCTIPKGNWDIMKAMNTDQKVNVAIPKNQDNKYTELGLKVGTAPEYVNGKTGDGNLKDACIVSVKIVDNQEEYKAAPFKYKDGVALVKADKSGKAAPAPGCKLPDGWDKLFEVDSDKSIDVVFSDLTSFKWSQSEATQTVAENIPNQQTDACQIDFFVDDNLNRNRLVL